MTIISFLSYLIICIFVFACVISMVIISNQQDRIKEIEEDLDYITKCYNNNTDRINDFFKNNEEQLKFLGIDTSKKERRF